LNNTTTTAVGSAFTNQPANDGVEVVSDNAADTTQTVTIIGTTNGADTVVVETITLTGTTPAASVKTDWGVILAVKKSAVTLGTVTVREASGDATITAGLTAAVLSVGVTAVAAADQAAYNRVVSLVSDGATTKQIGLQGTNTAGTTIYDSQALAGTTAVSSNSQFLTVTEIYRGDLESGRTATETADGTLTLNAGKVALPVTDDVATNATMYPVWVTAATGNLPLKVSSTKLSFNPSTGILTATGFSGPINGTVGAITAASVKATVIQVPSGTGEITWGGGLRGWRSNGRWCDRHKPSVLPARLNKRCYPGGVWHRGRDCGRVRHYRHGCVCHGLAPANRKRNANNHWGKRRGFRPHRQPARIHQGIPRDHGHNHPVLQRLMVGYGRRELSAR